MLIIVLVVIAVLSLAAYTFSTLMITHHHAVRLNGRLVQSRMSVQSGIDAVTIYLMSDPTTR